MLALWIAVVVLLGLLVGVIFGVLKWSADRHVVPAIAAGGGACVAVITIGLIIVGMFHK